MEHSWTKLDRTKALLRAALSSASNSSITSSPGPSPRTNAVFACSIIVEFSVALFFDRGHWPVAGAYITILTMSAVGAIALKPFGSISFHTSTTTALVLAFSLFGCLPGLGAALVVALTTLVEQRRRRFLLINVAGHGSFAVVGGLVVTLSLNQGWTERDQAAFSLCVLAAAIIASVVNIGLTVASDLLDGVPSREAPWGEFLLLIPMEVSAIARGGSVSHQARDAGGLSATVVLGPDAAKALA